MTYVFGKLVWSVLRPSNFLLLLAVIGVLGLGRRRRWAVRLVTTSVLVMLVCTLLPVGMWLSLPLENRFPRPPADLEPVTGIIVLGGGGDGAVTRARGIPSFGETMERFAAIPELALRYPTARILFSGGLAWGGGQGDLPEADVIDEFIARQGVPPGRVELEGRALSTRENALFTLELAKPKPGERWLLVTSARHMPRAIGVFRAAGWPELTPWPVDYRTTGRLDLGIDPMLGARLMQLDDIAYEYYGLIYYRILGYIDDIYPGPEPG